MQKVKIIIWAVVIGLVVMAVFQNQNYFLTEQNLTLNLYFVKYQTPALANGLLILISFLLGLLITYFFNVAERFRTRKQTKKLNSTIASKQADLSSLRDELAALKNTSLDRQDNGDPVKGDQEKSE